MKLTENRRTLITGIATVLTGIGVALGYVDPSDIPAGAQVTYDTIDKIGQGGNDSRGIGILGALIGLATIFQRAATAKVQAKVDEVHAQTTRGPANGG